ncbi:MAG: purine-nucleoside phosphorylase [Trueperaceae bacterium]|nr:MAG: purine-nucleoside phosphorylase [Trueperaceae bacterium]
MSIHIGAEAGDIAETVLLPGDPLRAKHMAETFLEDVKCYNDVRGMYGFTGSYQGKRVSIQGTGMGVPSISIYLNELISAYGAKRLIRVGTCGALQPDLELRDVILATAASTTSAVNKMRFGGQDFAPTATFSLLSEAYAAAVEKGVAVRVGSVITSDLFYWDDPHWWQLWADHGVLAVEMETSALYTLAAKFKVEALSILTVSDSLVTHKEEDSEIREKAYTQMVELALELAS